MQISVDRLLALYILLLLGWALLSAAYARFLQSIHHIYNPDHIDKTVIGGVALIGAGGAVTAALGITDWRSWFVYAGLALAVGLPILLWQRQQRRERAKKRRAARHRKERDE